MAKNDMRDTKKSKGRKRKEKGGGKEAWVRWLFSMWVHDVGSGHLKTTNIYRVGEGTMNDDQLFIGYLVDILVGGPG